MNIQEKIEQVEANLKMVAEQHNQLLEQKTQALRQFTELQGSLKTLQQLKEEEDAGTDS